MTQATRKATECKIVLARRLAIAGVNLSPIDPNVCTPAASADPMRPAVPSRLGPDRPADPSAATPEPAPLAGRTNGKKGKKGKKGKTPVYAPDPTLFTSTRSVGFIQHSYRPADWTVEMREKLDRFVEWEAALLLQKKGAKPPSQPIVRAGTPTGRRRHMEERSPEDDVTLEGEEEEKEEEEGEMDIGDAEEVEGKEGAAAEEEMDTGDTADVGDAVGHESWANQLASGLPGTPLPKDVPRVKSYRRNWRRVAGYDPPAVRSVLTRLSRLTRRTTSPAALLTYTLARAEGWKTLASHHASRSKDEMRRLRRARKERAFHSLMCEIAPTRRHIVALGTGYDGSRRTPRGRRYTTMNRGFRRFICRHRVVVRVCEWGSSKFCPRSVSVMACCFCWWRSMVGW